MQSHEQTNTSIQTVLGRIFAVAPSGRCPQSTERCCTIRDPTRRVTLWHLLILSIQRVRDGTELRGKIALSNLALVASTFSVSFPLRHTSRRFPCVADRRRPASRKEWR